MTEVCHDVCVEPSLQPITGECSRTPLRFLMMEPDERLRQMGLGAVAPREPSSMWRFSTPMLLQTDNPSPPSIENTKTKRKELTSKEFAKVSMVLSLLWSHHFPSGLGNAASVCYKCLASLIFVKRDIPSWLGSDVAYHFSFFAHLSGVLAQKIGHAVKQQFPPLDRVSSDVRFSSSG